MRLCNTHKELAKQNNQQKSIAFLNIYFPDKQLLLYSYTQIRIKKIV